MTNESNKGLELLNALEEGYKTLFNTQTAPRDRKTFIGGSDAAAILGVSPWKTPVELWMQKTGKAEPEVISYQKQRVFARGKKLEPYILEMVIDKLEELGHEVELVNTNKIYVDPEHKFLECEIDFELILDGEHINGDCKSVHGFARKKWGEEETEEIPIEYAAQFMHGLMITGRNKCLVAALIGIDDIAIYWLYRDDETIQHMRAKEVLFWNEHVLKQVPPDVLVFDDIKALFPIDNGGEIEASSEIAAAVIDLKAVKQKIKVLEEEETELKFQIGNFIQPASALFFEGRKIATWKAQASSQFLLNNFREDHPELANQYTDKRTNRVLRLSK